MADKKLVMFALINPSEKMVNVAGFERLKPDALRAVDLDKKGVDFGALAPDHFIVVYEFGLFEKPEEQSYFALGRNLYAGNAVVFHEDAKGNLVDVDPVVYNKLLAEIRFFNSSEDVEKAITADEITQPSMTVGGEVVWTWPQPRPDVLR